MKKTLLLLASLLSAGTLFAATAPYPLKVCLVTGEELGSMGKPVVKVYDEQEIKFCCKSWSEVRGRSGEVPRQTQVILKQIY